VKLLDFDIISVTNTGEELDNVNLAGSRRKVANED